MSLFSNENDWQHNRSVILRFCRKIISKPASFWCGPLHTQWMTTDRGLTRFPHPRQPPVTAWPPGTLTVPGNPKTFAGPGTLPFVARTRATGRWEGGGVYRPYRPPPPGGGGLRPAAPPLQPQRHVGEAGRPRQRRRASLSPPWSRPPLDRRPRGSAIIRHPLALALSQPTVLRTIEEALAPSLSQTLELSHTVRQACSPVLQRASSGGRYVFLFCTKTAPQESGVGGEAALRWPFR